MCEHRVTSGFHCGACHRDFTSLSAFDRHQSLDPREGKIICLDPVMARDTGGAEIFTVNAGNGKFSLAPRPGFDRRLWRRKDP